MIDNKEIQLLSPAKINLFLAITGIRQDGYHSLVSLVSTLDFGDIIGIRYNPKGYTDSIKCSIPEIANENNLAFKALQLFRTKYNFSGTIKLSIDKHIPLEGGLGGGSSNATTTLLGLNQLFNNAISSKDIHKLAVQIGSDCPLFINKGFSVIKGRGEKVYPIECALKESLKNTTIILFKPDFSISTIWAYEKMKEAHPSYYISESEVEFKLEKLLNTHEWNNLIPYNNLSIPTFKKYIALPTLLNILRCSFNIPCMLSGSGSVCFAISNSKQLTQSVIAKVKESLGKSTWITTCTLQ